MSKPTNRIVSTATEVRERANGVAKEIGSQMKETWHKVHDESDRALREAGAYVKGNPIPTGLVLFGAGLAVGWFLRPSRLSLRDRFVSEPIEEAQGTIRGMIAALNTLLRTSVSSASDAAGHLADDARSEAASAWKPVKKAARRVGEQFGL